MIAFIDRTKILIIIKTIFLKLIVYIKKIDMITNETTLLKTPNETEIN